jgi:hypothetical protein
MGHLETMRKRGLDCGGVSSAMMYAACHPSILPPVCHGPLQLDASSWDELPVTGQKPSARTRAARQNGRERLHRKSALS